MNRKKLYSFFAGTTLILAISFGFLNNSNDDPTTAVSFSNITKVEEKQQTDLGTWTTGAPITSPGSYGGAGVGYTRNDTMWLYAINGDISGSGATTGNWVRRYNITTNTWSNIATNSGRAWTSATKAGPVSATKIYQLGGLPDGASSFGQMTNTLQIYDINTNVWTLGSPALVATGSSGMDSYQDSIVYAIGGMGTTGNPINNVQLYNTVSNTWRAATPLPVARANGWVVIKSDTIYYGCGVGPTTATYNNTIYVGKISATDRSVITWTTSTVTYPGASRHRQDADDFGCFGMIIGPGATTGSWFGTSNDSYTWQGGTSPFVSVGPTQATSDAMVGSASFQRGNYRVWKFVVSSGLILAAPYHILTTQIYTDSCLSAPPAMGWCEGFTSTTFPPTGWSLTGSAALWSRATVSGFGNGTGSAKADFYGVSTGTQQLNTHVFTPATGPGDSLIFQNAYATYQTENDQLQIQTSTNGGTTWVPLVTLNGGVSGQLVTAPPQTAEFTPTSSQWKYQRLALPTGTNRIQFNAITAYGNNLYVDSICVKANVTGISGNNNGIPKDFKLSQNYPNPFNPSTQISFSLPKASVVKLVVYDMTGREITSLVNEFRQAGNHNVTFDASSLSSGVYFYKIIAGDFTETKKMVLMK
jgi:hypothetical protein